MDIRNIQLKDKYDAAIIPGAGFCYLLTDSEINQCFKSIQRHVIKNGILIFEFWQTPLTKSSLFTGGSWNEITESKSTILKLNSSKYDKRKNLLTKIYQFYVLDKKLNRQLTHFKESHITKTYSIHSIKKLLKKSGFMPISFYSEDLEKKKLKPSTKDDFRVLCVAKMP